MGYCLALVGRDEIVHEFETEGFEVTSVYGTHRHDPWGPESPNLLVVGRTPPRIRLPLGALLPIAFAAEAWATISGRGEPFVTIDGLRMARRKMFFTSRKAAEALGYQPRPAAAALADAVTWFRDHGNLP